MPRECLTVSAPGRLCLFGEHQDFLGLPVIAAAFDRAITIEARPRGDELIVVHMPDVHERDQFDPRSEISYAHERDYVRSATNVLRRAGLRPPHGYDCTIRGTIPLNAGCCSSSALTVAWVSFVLAAAGAPLDPEDVARLAHQAEVVEFNEPGGMMDHYTSALGGLVHIDTGSPIRVTPLPARLEGFVLGDSRTPKDTTSTLAQSRAAMRSAVQAVRQQLPSFDLPSTSLAEVRPFLPVLPQRGREMLEGNLANRDLLRLARGELEQERPDLASVGALLTEHHRQLSRHIQVSTPLLDRMVEAALEAGALGAKMNGSGGGGCMFALAPGREVEVQAAIAAAGGEASPVHVRGGVEVQRQPCEP